MARFGHAPPASAWENQGFALAGFAGLPALTGVGTLATGSANAIDLAAASPLAPAALFVALSSTPTPFAGGTLLPSPAPLVPPAATSAAGEIPLPFVMPPGLAPSTAPWLQWAIQDAGAVQGVALSNALRGVTPSQPVENGLGCEAR